MPSIPWAMKRSCPPANEEYAFDNADVLCGDFRYIRSCAPDLSGKTIVTDTVSAGDVANLRRRGAVTLAATTPIPDEGEGVPMAVYEAALSFQVAGAAMGCGPTTSSTPSSARTWRPAFAYCGPRPRPWASSHSSFTRSRWIS